MSDHDPNGDDDFLKVPLGYGHNRNDDSNMGHESVPLKQPVSRKTMAYSIVDETEAKKRHGGTAAAALASTELMPIYTPQMDIKSLISFIIERDVKAWKSLPVSVQELMLVTPNKFRLLAFEGAGLHDAVPDIFYEGVRFRWVNDVWKLYSIELIK